MGREAYLALGFVVIGAFNQSIIFLDVLLILTALETFGLNLLPFCCNKVRNGHVVTTRTRVAGIVELGMVGRIVESMWVWKDGSNLSTNQQYFFTFWAEHKK